MKKQSLFTKTFTIPIFKALLLMSLLLSSINSIAQGTWTQKADYGGGTVSLPITGFTMGTKAYVGTGNNGSYLQDFWEWDQAIGIWVQKASFPGNGRFSAVGFAIGNKGYIGTGSINSGAVDYQDFWEWDSSSLVNGLDINGNPMGAWTRKADFAGGARHGAVGFSIGNKGYIGTGSTGSTKYQDLWEYDPTNLANGLDVNGNPMGAWIAKTNLGGVARNHAVGFSISTKGYIGTGNDASSTNLQDFWEWDQTTDTWVQKANLSGTARYAAVGFSLSNKGYIGTGINPSGSLTKDFFEWDPTNISNGLDGNGNPMGAWTSKANFGGTSRYCAFGFSIGCNGYIGAGNDGGLTKDFWEWNPVIVNVSPPNPFICVNGNVILTASGASTYQWSPAIGLSSITGAVVTATPALSTTYTVIGTDGNGCKGSDTVAVKYASSTLNLTKTNVSCNSANNGSATATVLGGTAPYSYSWSNGGTNSTISNLAPGTYSVTVNDASCNISGTELITNGNFDGGNVGFSSALTYTPPPNTNGSQYWVGTNPASFNSLYCACTEHSGGTGNFMFLNGNGAPHDSSWCQTVSVTPNTRYYFSAWVTTLYPESQADLALLQIDINGQAQSNVFNTPSSCCAWQQIFVQWNSGSSTTARICIVNNCLSTYGNDFGLDDISFQKCTPSCSLTSSITITQPAKITISLASANVHCFGETNGSSSANVTGGILPYNYSWTSGGTAASENGLAAGTYTVTVTDSNS